MPTYKLALPSLAFLLLAAPVVQAERIYQLVDYPDLQNGHTLSGTITVSDDAPADGFLVTEEIVDWQWSIAGGTNLSARKQKISFSDASGIGISTNAIYLPISSSAELELHDPEPTSSPGRFLIYATVGNAEDEKTALRYLARSLTPGRGGSVYLWDSSLDHPSLPYSTRWVIATAVPEPNADILTIAIIASLSFVRRQMFYNL